LLDWLFASLHHLVDVLIFFFFLVVFVAWANGASIEMDWNKLQKRSLLDRLTGFIEDDSEEEEEVEPAVHGDNLLGNFYDASKLR